MTSPVRDGRGLVACGCAVTGRDGLGQIHQFGSSQRVWRTSLHVITTTNTTDNGHNTNHGHSGVASGHRHISKSLRELYPLYFDRVVSLVTFRFADGFSILCDEDRFFPFSSRFLESFLSCCDDGDFFPFSARFAASSSSLCREDSDVKTSPLLF